MLVPEPLPVFFPSASQPITPLKARRPFSGVGLRQARRPRGRSRSGQPSSPSSPLLVEQLEKLSGWERSSVSRRNSASFERSTKATDPFEDFQYGALKIATRHATLHATCCGLTFPPFTLHVPHKRILPDPPETSNQWPRLRPQFHGFPLAAEIRKSTIWVQK